MTDPTPEFNEHPDWEGLKRDVCERLDYVAAAWEKLDAPPQWREKIRRDLLLPAVSLLAEFCACVEIGAAEDGEPLSPPPERRQED